MAEPVPLTIRRDWPRPDAKTLAAFKDAPTGFVVDAIGRAGALDHRIRPVWKGPHQLRQSRRRDADRDRRL